LLGYINYDISTCMQAIVAHYVDMTKYPAHQALLDDKHAFRHQIAHELGIDLKQAKENLSAADNGKKFRSQLNHSPSLKGYVNESEAMVDEFLLKINALYPEKMKVALTHAKHYWKFIAYDYDTKEAKLQDQGPKKFSIFFFTWTQMERQIREAMMSCFRGYVHEVHDAVYSKEDVDISVLENAVLKQTGIAVKIEK